MNGAIVLWRWGLLVVSRNVVGGIAADRWLGSRKAIMSGCVFMSISFISISVPSRLVSVLGLDTGPGGLPSIQLLLLSLGVVVVGNGLMKSSLAGARYFKALF